MLVIIIFITPLAAFGSKAYLELKAGEQALGQVEQALIEMDLNKAETALDQANLHLDKAWQALLPTTPYIIVPWLGAQVFAVHAITEAGRATLEAIDETLAFAGDVSLGLPPGATLDTLTPEDKRILLARVLEDVSKLERARDRLTIATENFNKIPKDGLFEPLARAVERIGKRLPQMTSGFENAVPLLKILPQLAGYPESSESLLLFLNNGELRPGGGFIGALGLLKMRDGEVEQLETVDSYAIDGPAEGIFEVEAPAPIKTYLNIPNWYLRDANWSPDFAVSAENVLHFYTEELRAVNITPPNIQQIIGFTPTFASELLRITGPVAVGGQTFTADNLFDALEYQVEIGFAEQGIPRAQRKEILAELVREMSGKLLALSIGDWEKVLLAVDKGFREKQIMVWSKNLETQRLLETEDWAGRSRFGEEDFFMVVDANMASLKTDPAIQRSITYTIEPDGNSYQAKVAITYRHTGQFDWKTTRYRTYTRLYVPEGSEFVGVTGSLKDDKLKNPSRELGTVDISSELGATVFGTFTAIEPGEERTLSFTYRMNPELVEHIKSSGEYVLRAEKQLGAAAYNLTLDLDFGKKFREYRVRTDLKEDRVFYVYKENWY